MKALLQRVTNASVLLSGEEIATIGTGILVLIGVMKGDTEKDAIWLANKVVSHRIFPDERAQMNLSIRDINGELLIISQFTLAASSKKGNRPDFFQAEQPERAQVLYRYFVDEVKQLHPAVQTGVFGAYMQIALVNDGPVTILLSSL